jgi:hypothetical protein
MSFLNRALSLAVIVTALRQPNDAVAGDYTVSYAFAGTTDRDVAVAVTNSLNEEGTRRDCTYGTSCKITLNKSDLEIRLDVSQAERDQTRIFVSAYGGRSHGLECCLFSDGQSTYSRQLREPLVRLYIYDGHRRKGNEVIQNIHLGILYLLFSDLK